MTNILVWELLLSFRLNWYFEAEGRATLKGEYLIWSACIFVNSDICLNIENSNYFLPNLWINAIFLQCCAFILRHVVCHYYKASLFLLFYWSFPQCASVVLTESTERCSVLIHAFFFFFPTLGIWSLSSDFSSCHRDYSLKFAWSDFFLPPCLHC